MKKNIIAALVVLTLVVSGVGVGAAQTDNTPLYDEIDARGELIIAQENLLNIYRCKFDVDTQVVPEGCTDGTPNKTLIYEPYERSGQTPVGTSTPTPTPSPTAVATESSSRIVIHDHYWSQDGRRYYVVFSTPATRSYDYCEVHLLYNGRRTGEWSNDFSLTSARRTIDVFGADQVTWDTWEIVCE